MKKSILFLSLLLFGLSLFGQKFIDKTNIEVMGYKFSVGDTIQLTTGKMPNGDFVSVVMSNGDGTQSLLPSGCKNMKFAISKIKTINEGNEVITTLIIKDGIINIYVIANTAIEGKEIVLK